MSCGLLTGFFDILGVFFLTFVTLVYFFDFLFCGGIEVWVRFCFDYEIELSLLN